MSDREEVISRLAIIRTWAEVDQKCGGINPECCADIVKWIDEALELLKDQEAIVIKRPKKLDEIYDYVAHCPECHMQWAMDDSERMRYCPGCGRRVKWDAVD